MKKILIFTLGILDSLTKISAQVDTMYYNNEGQEVHKALADYQRISVCDSNGLWQFIDRKISGEKLASGSYKKTSEGIKYEGTIRSYYPNGETKNEYKYKNGLMEGEQLEYDNYGGKITKHYKNGEIQGNYYYHTTIEGIKTKYSTKDGKMIWESPNTNNRKMSFNHGTQWEYYIANNIVIDATCTTIKDYGKWFRIDICITNGTDEILDIDPTKMFINVVDDINYRPAWNYERYMKKVRKQQNWESALLGLSAGINTYNASYSTSTVTTTTYGQGHIYTSYSTVQTYNPTAALYANTQNQIMFSQLALEQKASNAQICDNYLRETTLHPGDNISGYILIERERKDKKISVNVDINGAKYQFDWVVVK